MAKWHFERKYLLQVELEFPNLRIKGYQATSPPDDYYNCIAWAAGDQERFWSPMPRDQSDGAYDAPYEEYWPAAAVPENTLEAWKSVFALQGYIACQSAAVEAGFEKLAIYTDRQNVPQHVARQLPSGEWTSKLGNDLDIQHASPDALEGERYGQATHFMQRPLVLRP